MLETRAEDRYVRLLLDAALAARVRGDRAKARGLLDEALDLSRTENRPSLVAAVRASQGVLAHEEGNLDAAGRHLREALDLRRNLADSLGEARALGDLAIVQLEMGQGQEASRCLERAMEISRGGEPGRTRAEVLEHGAVVHARLGDPDRARSLFEEALALYERMEDQFAAGRVRSHLEHLGSEEPVIPGANLDLQISAIERARLVDALDSEGWNQSRAARRLGVTETRVRNLMRRHGLTPRNRRGRPRKTSGPAEPGTRIDGTGGRGPDADDS